MKKSILFLSILASLVACKKSETAESPNNSDSVSISQKIEEEKVPETVKADSIPKNEEQSKKDENEEILKNPGKNIDSISKAISKIDIKSKAEKVKDTATKEPEKVVNVQITPPKVYKETKIIYKNTAKPEETKASKNWMQKNATMEISVNDVAAAKETAKYEIRKYDGIIKSENLQNNENMQLAYLKIKVPMEKFEYLMDELSSENIGKIESKNIEIIGSNYSENAWCTIELTIYNKNADNATNGIANNNTFAGKSMSAISSGWKILENIFLFLLPFWPLFLIGSFAYFYYKSKKLKKTENTKITDNK